MPSDGSDHRIVPRSNKPLPCAAVLRRLRAEQVASQSARLACVTVVRRSAARERDAEQAEIVG